VGAGRFYRGLFNQLASNTISLMPLRDRPNDLEQVARSLVKELAGENRVLNLDQSAMDKILSHYWSFNLEELRDVLEESISTFEGEVLSEEHLSIGEKRTQIAIQDDESEGIRLMSLKDAEKLLIKKALIHTSENRTQAAKILGVSIRTLRNKINEYRNGGSSYFVNLR
ncbi:MAG: helix-turn-helix domain-containing protein, partial [Bdellovibrionota bacterium]